MSDLEIVYEQLKQFTCVEDLFGMEIPVNRTYRKIYEIVRPASNQGQIELADQAVTLLKKFHEYALESLVNGTYGTRRELPWSVPSRTTCYAAEEKC